MTNPKAKLAIQKLLNQLNLLINRNENAMFIGFHVNRFLNSIAKETCQSHIVTNEHDDYCNHDRLDLLRQYARNNQFTDWDNEATYRMFVAAEVFLRPIHKEYPRLLHPMPARQELFPNA